MPGVEESVRGEVTGILNGYRRGHLEFPKAVAFLADYFQTLSAEEQTAYFDTLATQFSSEPFDAPMAVHTIIIHVWAALGPTDDLVSKIFSGVEQIESARARSWNIGIGSQFVHSLLSFQDRFSKSTLDHIKAQSSVLANTGIPDLIEIARRLDLSIERIRLERRASEHRQKSLATQAAEGNYLRPSAQDWSPGSSESQTRVETPVAQTAFTKPRSSRGRRLRKRPSTRNESRAPKLPGERRARTVAKLIRELDTLKPSMNDERDYASLARRYPDFLCFKIARKYDHLREKLVNIQEHKQHIRLAQEMAAAGSGKKLSTIQTNWKRYKPHEYRRKMTKSPKIPKNPHQSPHRNTH